MFPASGLLASFSPLLSLPQSASNSFCLSSYCSPRARVKLEALSPRVSSQGAKTTCLILTFVAACDRSVVLVAFAGLLSALSFLPGSEQSLFRELNQELGAMCQQPPEQALRVCRLHARLLR